MITQSFIALALMTASSPPDIAAEAAPPARLVELEITIPASLHTKKLALPAKFVHPEGSGEAVRRPAIIVLHGSGGLTSDDQTKCGPDTGIKMARQFKDWAERLAGLGYAVLLPSSYSARGFCDKHHGEKMPADFDRDPEQVFGRLYDLDAAGRWLCERSDVDCHRLGLLGFSQGATTVMLALHWQLDRAIDKYREAHQNELDLVIEPLKAMDRPVFQAGIAYYPGCGFDGVIPRRPEDVEDKYSPAEKPLLILHAQRDPFLPNCKDRKIQAREVAEEQGFEDTCRMRVLPGMKHGFDVPDCKGRCECEAAKWQATSELTAYIKPRPLAPDRAPPRPPERDIPPTHPPCPAWSWEQLHASLQTIDPRLAQWLDIVRDALEETTRWYLGHC